MPFGLAGAPATFLGAMNTTLQPVLCKWALVFFDDILIYGPSLAQHAQHLQQVLALLPKDQWFVKWSKCVFAQPELNYLGHTISVRGVATDIDKIWQVWPVPSSVKEVCDFLGLVGYYRRFVRHFGIIARPLTNQLRKHNPVQWTDITNEAFEALKSALVSTPILVLPYFTMAFIIETDACDYGVGVVLQQEGHPIAYLSKALGPKMRGLCTYEKEYLATVFALDQWHLQFSEFIIKTDQKSLVHLEEQQCNTPE